MKLLNYTLFYLTSVLFAIVSLWAVLFYFQILNQLKATMDEGLANYKILLIDDLKDDADPVQQNILAEKNFSIKNIPEDYALQVRDSYKDTLVFSSLKNAYYRSRLLTTAFAAENGQYYQMKIISQELDRGELIRNLAVSLLWLYLLVLISIILVNNFVLKNTWKPFYKTLDYLRNFRLDKETFSGPPKTKIKEFSVLNETIQQLLKENVDTFLSQKQFIENASHELQTPLAIAINKLELLEGADGLTDEHTRKIETIIQMLQRLAGINKSLLLISKIENKQFAENKNIDFNQLLSQVLSDFSDLIEFRKIKISYAVNANWNYKMNRHLAEIMVRNLVQNAIFHNFTEGEIEIELFAGGFTIENTSTDSALNPDELFKRFNKNKNKAESTGLGLAIVKAIANVSGLAVSYSFNATGKHVIKVSSL